MVPSWPGSAAHSAGEGLRRVADDNTQEVVIKISARNLSSEQFAEVRKQLAGLSGTTRQSTKDTKDFSGSLGDAVRKSDLANLSIKKLAAGYVAGALSFEAITSAGRMFVGFLRESVAEAIAADTAQRRLDTALRAQSRSAPEASKQLAALTREFQRSTIHSGDLLLEMEALLVQVGGVMPHQMGKALTAATDLSAGLGIDLRQATMLVAKAFAGETGSLSRYGIHLDETRAKTDAAGAALEAIHARFGGQARSEAESYAGSVARVGNAWNDLKQVVGEKILQDPKVEIGIRAITRALDDQDDQLDRNTLSFHEFLTTSLRYLSIGGAIELALGEINDALRLAHKVSTDAAAGHDQWVESVTRGRAITPVTAGLVLFNHEVAESERQQKAAKKAAEEHVKAIAGLRKELSGTGAVQAVNDLREALQGLPPVSQLTQAAHERIITTLARNADAYDRLGAVARRNLRQILGDTLALVEPTARLGMPVGAFGRPIFHEGAQLEPIPGSGIPFGFGGFLPAGSRHLPAEPPPGTVGLPGGFLPGRILGPEAAPGAGGFWSGAFGGSKGLGSFLGGTALSAIMNGGGAKGALTSMASGLGSAAMSGVAKLITSGAGMAISGVMGGALNAVLPGIGALAGPLLGKLFGGLFGKSEDRKRTEAATAKIGEIEGQFLQQFGGAENVRGFERLFGEDILDTFGNRGEQGLKNVTADVEAFTKKVEALKGAAPQIQQLVTDASRFGDGLPERFAPFLGQMRELGLIQGEQGFNWKQLQGDAERYGIDLGALGPKFQGARLKDSAIDILNVFESMKSNGADVGAVLFGMREEISALVQDSIQFGTTIPENMRPLIEDLAKSGNLLDANGQKMTDISGIQFGEPVKVGLDAVVDRLDKLLVGLGIKLPEAIAAGVEGAAGEATRLADIIREVTDGIPRNIPITVSYRAEGDVPEPEDVTVRGAAAGGLFTRPTFRVFAEREPEVAGSPNMIVTSFLTALKAAGFTRIPGENGGGQSVTIVPIAVPLSGAGSGTPLTDAQLRQIRDWVASGKIPVPERTVVRRLS